LFASDGTYRTKETSGTWAIEFGHLVTTGGAPQGTRALMLNDNQIVFLTPDGTMAQMVRCRGR
jgi:hypothetical protein